MKTHTPSRRAASCTALLIGLAAPTLASTSPAASIHVDGGSVAFIAGVHWGGGTLRFKGRRYALKVSGLSVGAIGASSYDVDGEVYDLRRARDIEGTYAAIEASATAGEGAGALEMKKDKGVRIRARSSSEGLKLSLGPQGVVIQLKR